MNVRAVADKPLNMEGGGMFLLSLLITNTEDMMVKTVPMTKPIKANDASIVNAVNRNSVTVTKIKCK